MNDYKANDACPAGTYQSDASNTEVKVCIKIPPGHEIKSGKLTPCASGYYKTGHGAGTCTICPSGSQCPFPDQDK